MILLYDSPQEDHQWMNCNSLSLIDLVAKNLCGMFP